MQLIKTIGESRVKHLASIMVTVVVAVFFCFYFLPNFQFQYSVSFFSYTESFVKPFFDGLGEKESVSMAQGIVPSPSMQSDGSLWGEPFGIKPRISEFLWRFVGQFYLNTPLLLCTVLLVSFVFIALAYGVTGCFTPLLLPLFFYFFAHPEPIHASISVNLLIDMAFLNIFMRVWKHVSSVKGRIGAFVLLGVMGALSLWLWLGNHTPAFSLYPPYLRVAGVLYVGAVAAGLCAAFLPSVYGKLNTSLSRLLCPLACGICAFVFLFGFHQNPRFNPGIPLQKTLLRVQVATFQNNHNKVIALCNSYYKKHGDISVSKLPQDEIFIRNRIKLGAFLEAALLQAGLWNDCWLDYIGYPEFKTFCKGLLPSEYEIGYAYIKLYDALGLYAPQSPYLFTFLEKTGWQNRYMEPLLRMLVGTHQTRLLQRTLRYRSHTLCGAFHPDRQDYPFCETEDGALPFALASPALTKGTYNLNEWVKIYVEKATDSSFANISPSLLDYYTFEALFYRNINLLPLLANGYREKGREHLPGYVQEGLCLQAGFPFRISRETLQNKTFGDYHIDEDYMNFAERFWRDYTYYQQRKISWGEMNEKYGFTYTWFYLFGQSL